MIEYALRALQFMLAAGGFVMVYLTVSPLVGASVREEVSLPAPEGIPALDTALPRYQIISERNLFRQIDPPAAPTDAPLAESRLAVTLTGTTVADDPALSTAIVQGGGTRTGNELKVVKIGDKLQTAEVVRIEPRRLVVLNEGKLEAITLEDEAAAVAPSRNSIRRLAREREDEAPRPEPPANNDESRVRPPSAEDIERLRSAFQEQSNLSTALAQIMRDFNRQARLTPSLTPDGEVDGLRVTRVTRGSDLAAAGLLAGDRIQSINGYPVSAISGNPGLLLAIPPGTSISTEVVGVDGTIRTVVLPSSAAR
jgi:type II secretory pathway component PulC